MTNTQVLKNSPESSGQGSAAKPERVLSDIEFNQFDLPESIMAGLRDAGFTQCTPIQADTLPLVLAGRDVAGQARTGTGKTAAFLLAIFKSLVNDRNPEQAGRDPCRLSETARPAG
ncbi:MAG: DEAD/DEAH box helicase [Xanthomonadaceae bacterium]|nr:DEAD/DEAH box helicase [Xanthomonadaceae bacterium]